MTDSVEARKSDIIEDIPDGDCVLIVGPALVRINANSVFLRAASGPFRAMFKPEWREGDELRARTDPIEIALPEDDAVAMQLLCAVIHHQNDSIPRELPIPTVLAIAVTADKYDCIRALRFASELWLRSRRGEVSDMLVLAAAAYLFENATAFRDITKKIILSHNGPFSAVYCGEAETIMDNRVFGLLEEARSTARLELADILISGLNYGECVHKCGWSSKYAYAYMNLLHDHDLWPRGLGRQSIADAIAKAGTIPDPIPKESSGTCAYSYKHCVPAYRENRQYSLDALDRRIGLCLHCIRSGGENAARCEVQH